MNEQEFDGLIRQLAAMLVKQDSINDDLRAIMRKHEERIDNHDEQMASNNEQIARLIRLEERFEAFIERQFKPDENGR